VTIEYVTADGTATAGADYTATSGTLTFATGQADRTFTVPILDDGLHEDDETVALSLSNPGGDAALGAPSSATLTIFDDDPIDTAITGGPDGPTDDATPTFSFTANPAAGSTFECWVDDATPASCSSPFTTTALGQGGHTFHVRAKNGSDTDPSPASRGFFVDTVAPRSAVALEPVAGLGERAGSGLAFAGTVLVSATALDPGPGSGLAETRCVIDPPSPPASFAALSSNCAFVSSVGEHTVYAASRDGAGNLETPVVLRFTILRTPSTSITSGPSGVTVSAAVFTFVSDQRTATFECSIDGGAYRPCSSPMAPSGLKLGELHTLSARAVSAAGARDPSPASRSFTPTATARTQGCEILIEWDGRGTKKCTALRDRCPTGSLCTLKNTVISTDDDRGISWYGSAVVRFAALDKGNSCWSHPAGDPRYSPCPARISLSHLGAGETAEAICSTGGSVSRLSGTTRGPDDVRIVACRATLRIEPAVALGFVVGGSDVSTFAPGAGSLALGATGGFSGRLTTATAALAKRKSKPPIAPVRITVKKAGRVKIPIKLSKPAKRVLDRRHKLKLTLKLSYKPKGAKKATVKTKRVTLTSPGCPSPKNPRKLVRCR